MEQHEVMRQMLRANLHQWQYAELVRAGRLCCLFTLVGIVVCSVQTDEWHAGAALFSSVHVSTACNSYALKEQRLTGLVPLMVELLDVTV
jgi:hypothetical protein